MRLFFLTHFMLLLLSCRLTEGGGGEINPPDSSAFIHYSSVQPIDFTSNTTIYDSFAFASDGYGSIAIYNVNNAYQPHLMTSLALPTGNQSIRKIAVDWRFNLYIAAGSGGVFIVNCSNQYFPSIEREFPHLLAYDLSMQEDYIVTTDRGGWKLFYLTSASNMTEIGSYDFFDGRQPEKILIRGNWVYVTSKNHFDIFDITNSSNIRHEGSFSFTNSVVDFDIIGDFIVLLTTHDLYYIDISQPLYAEIAGYYGLQLMPKTMRVRGHHLFISWTNNSFSAYKVWGINTLPTEESRINFSNMVLDIHFNKDLIYLSKGYEGLHVYYYME